MTDSSIASHCGVTSWSSTSGRAPAHLDVVPLLAPAGAAGREFFELAAEADAASAHREVGTVTGRAGDVWLCHPFVVHSAQAGHRGTQPRFMAQPPLIPSGALAVDGPSPVERAIAAGLP